MIDGDGEGIIYVVASGNYSDYGIDGVFNDRALADAFAERFTGDGYGEAMNVEEWTLNPFRREVAAGYEPYKVTMAEDGNGQAVRGAGADVYLSVTRDRSRYWGKVLAKDDRHALKIMNEFRSQVRALPYIAPSEGSKMPDTTDAYDAIAEDVLTLPPDEPEDV